jgi:hypothetical protein
MPDQPSPPLRDGNKGISSLSGLFSLSRLFCAQPNKRNKPDEPTKPDEQASRRAASEAFYLLANGADRYCS